MWREEKRIAGKVKEHLSPMRESTQIRTVQIIAYLRKEKNKTVFINLKNSFDFPNAVACYCDLHILHNAAKRGLTVMSFHLELL
jgi:hypothetical protein